MSGCRAGRAVLMPVFNEIDYDGRVQRIAEAVAAEYDVTVLCLDSGRGYSNSAFTVRTVALPAGASVLRQVRFWRAVISEARRLRPAVVHAHDFFTAAPGRIAAAMAGAKLIYDAHELIVPEKGKPLGRRKAFFYRAERWALKRADLVIAANPERAEIMREHYGLKQAPTVVRNIAPVPPKPRPEADVIADYPQLACGSEGLFRIVYQGDISLKRGLAPFVEALAHMDENVQLVLVGDGADLQSLRDRAEREGLGGRLVCLGKVPREHIFDILRTCDAGIVSYTNRDLNSVYCAPNKLYDYAQAGLPVLATPQPPLKSAVEAYGIGEIVESEGKGSHAAEAVSRLRGRLQECRSKLPAFLAEHNWENERGRLLAAYARLFDGD